MPLAKIFPVVYIIGDPFFQPFATLIQKNKSPITRRSFMTREKIAFLPDQKEAWTLNLSIDGKRRKLRLTPPEPVHVEKEYCEALPVFNPDARWNAPYAFKALTRRGYNWTECGLIPGSVVISSTAGKVFKRGKDYECEEIWGSAGRLEKGKIREGMPVFISYDHCLSRLDSVIRNRENGEIRVICGKTHPIMPRVPALPRGWERLANIYYSRHYDRLTEEMIYPVTKKRFSRLPRAGSAEPLLPGTLKKLRKGKKLRVLAWGDSVTECNYLPENQHWQVLFTKALAKKYPRCKIELISRGWDGHTSMDFLAAAEDSPFHFASRILETDADLIVSEFVNDAGTTPERFIPAYEKILKAFRAAGKEWIILTPHWILASWMAGHTVREIRFCKDDPRKFVHFLRDFTEKNGIALADASAKYAEWAEMGFPYMACMTNGINHPDLRGMKLFSAALMELFPAEKQVNICN